MPSTCSSSTTAAARTHRPVPPMDQWAPEDVEAHMAFLKQREGGGGGGAEREHRGLPERGWGG